MNRQCAIKAVARAICLLCLLPHPPVLAAIDKSRASSLASFAEPLVQATPGRPLDRETPDPAAHPEEATGEVAAAMVESHQDTRQSLPVLPLDQSSPWLAGPFLDPEQTLTPAVWLPLVGRNFVPPVDSDRDGLPDGFEDLNGNGIVEPDLDETDPLDPDCDDDGLTDGRERMTLGTHPWLSESDGDTLGDYLEVHTTHTNPATADSDADGLTDEIEDADRDGVLDPDETDPNDPDSDDDGLSDGEEATAGDDGYITNPRLPDTDEDGLDDGQEADAATDPTHPDPDGDDLDDPEEIAAGVDGHVTDPWLDDTDGDGLDDGQEAVAGSDPLNSDSDADRLDDHAEVMLLGSSPILPDTDYDTVGDYTEVISYTTNPASSDTDGDGLPDPWEILYGLDPLVDDAADDPDGDGRSNLQEFGDGTNPVHPDSDDDGLYDGDEVIQGTDPLDFDSDDDGLSDGVEVSSGTDPLDDDSDDDGILDGLEPGWNADLDGDGLVSALDTDADGDGLSDPTEDSDLDGELDPGETAADRADTDDDGMPDPWELDQGFDPQDPEDRDGDPDSDDLPNRMEFTAGTDPHDADSDSDGLSDGLELGLGLDPTDAADATADLDADKLGNLEEFQAGTGLDDADSDDDTIIDGDEMEWDQDSDGDGLINALDSDADDDGLDDGTEVFVHFCDPLDPDSDDDELTDGDEVLLHGSDPLNPDTDYDSVPDATEVSAGTSPVDDDTDGDAVLDGEELVSGWNGDWAEGEDLGTPYYDDEWETWGAIHDGTGHILTWTLSDLPPGRYRVYLRARSLVSAGDSVQLTVQVSGGLAFVEDWPLMQQIYRWHSSYGFDVPSGGSITVTLEDPQAPVTSVLVDRLMLAVREADPVFLTTWAIDPDTDADGLQDGQETIRDSVWIEAEHYTPDAGLIIDDLEASNSKVLRNSQPGETLATVPPGHLFSPLRYEVFVRARRDPSVDPNAQLFVTISVPSLPPVAGALERLTDRYEWHAVNADFALPVTDTIALAVTAQTGAAQAVYLDKVLITPVYFEGIAQSVPFVPGIPGGEGIHPPPPPLGGLVVKQDLDSPSLWPYWEQALAQTGVWYEVWDVSSLGLPTADDLDGFGAVLWYTGHPDTGGDFDASAEAAAQAYLDAGGNLLLVSADYLNQGLSPFGQTYLGLDGYILEVTLDELFGQPGDPIGDGLGPFSLTPPTGWGGPLGQDTAFAGPSASSPFLWTSTGEGNSTDLDSGGFKTAFFAWPLAAIDDPGAQGEVLGAVLDWFGLPHLGLDQGTVTIPVVQPSGFVDPLDMDTDGDGDRPCSDLLPGSAGYLTDGWETEIQTNPFDIDTDGDGDLYPADTILDDYGVPLLDGQCGIGGPPDGHPDWTDDVDCNPLSVDLDDDLILDPLDPQPTDDDIDNDGLLDGTEDLNLNGSWDVATETGFGDQFVLPDECPSPYYDTDGDGLYDGLELGLTEPQGQDTWMDCFDPVDADGVQSSRPLLQDTDSDGLWDGPADPNGGEDVNGNGARDPGETYPWVPDTDKDGLKDGPEVTTHGTDPLLPDSDEDGLTDGREVSVYGTDPTDWDSDDDGFGDGEEIGAGSDPNDPDSRPPIASQDNVYLLALEGTEWERDGNVLRAEGTIQVGGWQSGGGRRLQSADWHRAEAYLDGERDYHVELDGWVEIDTDAGTVEGNGSLDVLAGGERIAIMDGDFELDAGAGTLAGAVNTSVDLGPWGKVHLELDSAFVDVRTGQIYAGGEATLTPVSGLSLVLQGSFVVQPEALKVAYDGDLSLVAGSVTIPLRGVEAEIDFTNGYFSGKASSVEMPGIGDIVNTDTPQAEFVLDTQEGLLKFSVQSGVTTELSVGPITLSIGQGGPGFAFEINVTTGYFYVQVSGIDLEAASINNVELEIDPSGQIGFEPDYTIPEYLPGSFEGHMRFAGDVSVVIPVKGEEPARPSGSEKSISEESEVSGSTGSGEESVGLLLNVKGEQVIRVPDDEGFLWASNSTIGIELAAGIATLGVEIGGSTSVYSLGGADPLLAIGVGAEGMSLEDLGLGLPDAFGVITPQPGGTAVFVYDLDDQVLSGAGQYTYMGIKSEVGFVLDSEELAVDGTLAVPLGGLEVEVGGSIDWSTGDIEIGGEADVNWVGYTLADAEFTLSNDGLWIAGTLDIPLVGCQAAVDFQVQDDGTFSFNGTTSLNPGGWGEMASASLLWTNSSLTIDGWIDTPVGDATISGTVTADTYHFTGSGSLTLGGFTMASASVTLDSTTGLYASGAVSVSGVGTATVSGAIQKNGHFSLTGTGELTPGGFELEGSFTLACDDSGTSFSVLGSLRLDGTVVASAYVFLEPSGAISGEGTVDWGAVTISVGVEISSSGYVSLGGSIEIDGTYNGFGIEGRLELSAEGSGAVSGELDFGAELGGYEVFSGSATVSSSGRVEFEACLVVCASATFYL